MAAILNTNWYINAGDGSTTGYYAITKWATATNYTVGQLRRPLTAPAVGNERVYICIVPGLSVTEPTWTFTKGVVNAGTVESFQECTGQAALNGDVTTSPKWTASSTFALGMIVMNTARTGFFIASAIAGTGTSAGSQPAGLTTPVLGAVTTDNAGANQISWTCVKATGAAFTAWGAPFPYVQSAMTNTWGVAGDDFFIGSASAESRATTYSITFAGLITNSIRLLSVSTAGSVPPVAADLTAGASVTTTGNSSISINGSGYIYGVTFSAGTGANAINLSLANGAAATELIFDTCALNMPCTGSASGIVIGSGSNGVKVALSNTTMLFNGSTAATITLAGCFFYWKNTPSAVGGTQTAILNLITFSTTSNTLSLAILEGLDLTFIASAKRIIANINSAAMGVAQIKNCKITSGVIYGTPATPAGIVDVVWADSAATDYIQSRRTYQGSLDVSTAKYNNATDGTTPISWQIVTTANSKRQTPFETFEIVQWVAAGTYAASTVQCTSATGSLLNSDIWVEAQYMGSSSTPVSSLASSGPATQLTAGSALAAGTWAIGGAGNNYSLALPSFTVNIAGYVRFVVKVAKASLTIYVDPAVTVA